MTQSKIEFNINDARAGKIAEVISNKTCKKILNLIAENDKELSVGDISNRLGIPINTADYNVKKLMDAELIEKTSSFFWSVKGKKIPTYRIANKKIIISPKTSFKGMIASIIAGGVVLGGIKMFINYSTFNSAVNMGGVHIGKDLAYAAAPSAAEKTISFISAPSIFQNIGLWILAGAALGLLGFFIFKRVKSMKGGLKKL